MGLERASFWPGRFSDEANRAFNRAIQSGMTSLRSLVIGSVGSFRDCWMFQRTLAKNLGCSLRTVQRALREGRQLGLIECHRAKAKEKAPEIGKTLPCGWSHRWVVGWGRAKETVEKLVNVARAKALVPGLFRKKPKKAEESATPHRRWTAEEIEAELARRQGQPPPN